MIKNPRPTRAETTDVANAIYQGTSAIMLSGETAAGQYPIEALKTMVRIAVRTECDINYLQRFKDRKNMSSPDVTNAISHATCTMAGDLNAAAILAVSKSGRTARMISKYRPYSPIIGACLTEKVYRQLGLSWGVAPLLLEQKNKAEELFDYAVDTAETAGLISKGDVVVLTAGVPLGVSGTTNLIKVQVAGHILVKGKGIAGKKIAANLCVCRSEEDLANFKEGDIIVAADTNNRMMEQMRQASGLIVEADSDSCHAAIAGLVACFRLLFKIKQPKRLQSTKSVAINTRFLLIKPNFNVKMQRYETNHRKKVVEETVQPVFLGAAVNYQKMICSEWVQTRGYQACVFCKLIPLRVCLSESAHLMQIIS